MAEHTAKSMAALVTLPIYTEQDVRTNRPRTKEIVDSSYPLLEVNRGAIASIKRCTFKYGSTEEHQLVIYYPPVTVTQSHTTSEREERRPILVFFYGGGLLHGARSSPLSNLMHNNLRAFFASRGILTIIPDYRLVPSITYPEGSEDVCHARSCARSDNHATCHANHSLPEREQPCYKSCTPKCNSSFLQPTHDMTALPALNFGPFIVIITPAFSLTLPTGDASPPNPDVPFNLNFNTQTHQVPHPTGHTDPPPAVAFLRAYHHQGDHFYTTDRSEMGNATSATTYTAEGTACDIFTTHQPSTVPLFRLYSSAANDHLYTTSAAERDNAVARCGYAPEGVAGFVYPTADTRGAVPLFRLYKAENVDHFYTTSAAEARHSTTTFGYADEGIACYVLPA